jgi:hypothetical protein
MPSLKETTGPVLAKVKYHQKEMDVDFQNSWDRPGICFREVEPVRDRILQTMAVFFLAMVLQPDVPLHQALGGDLDEVARSADLETGPVLQLRACRQLNLGSCHFGFPNSARKNMSRLLHLP